MESILWTWRYWSSAWVTRLDRPNGVKYKVKRPELRRASNKMSAPSRAPRIQYYHIVVFVRGAGGREKERRSEKLKSVETVVKGRRGDYLFDVRVKMAYVLYN